MENQPCRKSRSTCVCLRCLIDEVGDCDADVCRICHGEKTESEMPLMSPCDCKGSVRYVHLGCLLTWMETSGSLSCEICQFRYLTRLKLKPFKEWTTEGLLFSHEEERRIRIPKWLCMSVQCVTIFWWPLRMYRDWFIDKPESKLWALLHLLFNITIAVMMYIQCRPSIWTWLDRNSVILVLENSATVRDSRAKRSKRRRLVLNCLWATACCCFWIAVVSLCVLLCIFMNSM